MLSGLGKSAARVVGIALTRAAAVPRPARANPLVVLNDPFAAHARGDARIADDACMMCGVCSHAVRRTSTVRVAIAGARAATSDVDCG